MLGETKTTLQATKVLVCGGRNYNDRDAVWSHLDARHTLAGPITEIIHGGARGADTLAGEWADYNRVPVRTFPADWTKYGKSAGHIRNQQMLTEGKPKLVIAFPGRRGTANMVALARKARIRVEAING